MRKLIKILSIILVVVFCVQIIVPGATAITATPFVGNNVAKSASKGITLPSQNDGKIEADSIVQNIDSSDNEIVTPIMGEITELRTENAKHYRHEDGTYTAAVYPEPIHYMDSSGSWKDIDNTLTLKSVAGKATYTPTAAALDIRIPQDFSNNQMLTIGKDGYTVGMRIKSSDNLETMSRASATASTTITSTKAVINNNFESLQAVNTSTNIDASASNNLKVEAENKQLMKLEKKVSAVNYNGILDGANLQYVITPSRVKENIIVTKTQDSYTWERGTKLAGITGNGKNISYVYDSQGNRVQKTVNGVTTNYLYSGDLLMRQTDGTNTLDFQYDASGDMVGFIYNGIPYYYLRTVLNDVSGIVDGEGNIVAEYRYGAYGNIIYATGDLAAINPIRYRGYYYDTETNWYYLQSRYYNPEWCRFISPDCLFIAGDAINGSNMYAYCNNNPVKYIDTSGAAAETNKIDLTPVAEGIRIISGTLSQKIFKNAGEFFSTYTNGILDFLKNGCNYKSLDPNKGFAYSYPMIFIGTPILCIGSLTLLPLLDLIINPDQKFPESPEFELPTGIRHFTPWSMEFLSGYATYFLGFESDGGEKTYITNPNKFMWQSMVGYNWFYDYFFSLGGPIEKIVLPFEAPATNLFPDASYAVWCWKADYWNLGAGAEIGIYWQPIKALAERGFYRIDQENLLVDVNMQVTYDHSEDELSPDNHTEVLHGNGEQHLSLKQTSWWITNFTPKIQFVDLDALNVCQAVNFAESGIHSNLYEAFYEKYSNDDTHPELSWSVSEPQWEYLNFDSEYPYEFYLQY